MDLDAVGRMFKFLLGMVSILVTVVIGTLLSSRMWRRAGKDRSFTLYLKILFMYIAVFFLTLFIVFFGFRQVM